MSPGLSLVEPIYVLYSFSQLQWPFIIILILPEGKLHESRSFVSFIPGLPGLRAGPGT